MTLDTGTNYSKPKNWFTMIMKIIFTEDTRKIGIKKSFISSGN